MLRRSLLFAIAFAICVACLITPSSCRPVNSVKSKSLSIEADPSVKTNKNGLVFGIAGSDDDATVPSSPQQETPQTEPATTPESPAPKAVSKHTSAFDSLHPGKVVYSRQNFVFGGECSFRLKRAINLSWSDKTSWVSVAPNKYWKGASCGMCIAYQLGGAWKDGQETQYGIVVDECKGCRASTLQVYNDTTPDSNQPVGVVWRPVQCDVGESTVSYAFQGSNRYFIKVAVTNTRVPLKLLEYKDDDKFVPFNLTSDAYWTAHSDAGFPDIFQLRLTSMTGKVATENLPVTKVYSTREKYVVLQGEVQFPYLENVSSVN